jgi:hypothetical protein
MSEKGVPIPFKLVLAVWAGLLGSQIAFLVVALMIPKEPAGAFDGSLRDPFLLAGLGALTAGWILPQVISKKGSPTIHETQTSPHHLTGAAFRSYILRLALFESSTLFGFVASLLLQNPQFIIGFFFLNAISCVLNFPSTRFLNDWNRSH